MKKQPVLIALLVISIVMAFIIRFSAMGWLMWLGIFSVLIGSIIHFSLQKKFIDNAQQLNWGHIMILLFIHLCFLNLFLFQIDGGDDRGSIMISELFGRFSEETEDWLMQASAVIIIVSLILYFSLNFMLLFAIKSHLKRHTIRNLALLIFFLFATPIAFAYGAEAWSDLARRNKMAQEGKFENLKYALKHKEEVRYLRLYKYPNHYQEMPAEVFEFRNLEELEMYSNEITVIPPQIAKLKDLKKLNLIYNQIKVVPPEIGELEKLEELELLNNNVESISTAICNLNNLRELSIGGSQLTHVPECLSRLNSLKELSIGSDSINVIMPHLTIFKNLEKLDLYGAGRNNELMRHLQDSLPNCNFNHAGGPN